MAESNSVLENSSTPLQQRVSGIRDRLYGFVRFAPKDNDLHPRNDLAVDISFGSIGYSLALARPFKRVRVCIYGQY